MREQSLRAAAFMRDNLPAAAAILFLLVAGVASGVTVSGMRYEGQAADILDSLAAAFGEGYPYLRVMALSLLIHGALAAGGILSGLFAPALLLWPVLLWARGFLLGAALYIGFAGLPGWTALVLLLSLLMESALLLPSLLILYAEAGRELRKAQPYSVDPRPVAGLLLCALLQGCSLPLAFSVLT